MKKIILPAILLFFVSTSFSQSFMHGVGITVMGSTTGEGSNSDIGFGEGFTYTPRFNFLETEKLSVSVSVPLSLGISATTDSYDYYSDSYSSSIGFFINAPVIVSLNLGRGSTKENRQKMGYFFGAGFGFHHGDFIGDYYDPNTGDYSTSYSSNTFGPAANGGIRIGVGRKHKNIEVRLSYMKGINENKPNVFAIAGMFNF